MAHQYQFPPMPFQQPTSDPYREPTSDDACSDDPIAEEMPYIEFGDAPNHEAFDDHAEGCPFAEGDLRFLRDFILSSAQYVEELESLVCETSEDFWQSREHAYRIVTGALIHHFLYEMEEPSSYWQFGD